MPQQILQVDQAMLETTLDRVVRKTVEETLDAMLDAEADEITGAARYERSAGRKAYRAGHYERDPSVKAGRMSLKVPKLKGAIFSSAVIDRYRRREESVEEALIAGEGRGHGMDVLLQCLFDRFGSVFPQCGLMVFPGVVIVSR